MYLNSNTNVNICPQNTVPDQNSVRTLSVNNPDFQTNNGHITGNVNPKTLKAPVIVPHINSFQTWRHNPLTLPSQINHNSQYELYLSGYIPTDQCANAFQCHPKVVHEQVDDIQVPTKGNTDKVTEKKEKTEHEQVDDINVKSKNKIPTKENFEMTPSTMVMKDPTNIQHIQPHVFTSTHKPYIHSNIGISDTDSWRQRHPHTQSRYIENGTIVDSKFHVKPDKKCTQQNDINTTNVYDPRFTGYGSDKRHYWDSNIGQTRFMYDDVNAVRMPNYITRSKIDFLKYADTYGSLQRSNKTGNQNQNLRSLVHDSYLQNSLQFRNELQERLLRKRNNELTQIRKRPYHTNF